MIINSNINSKIKKHDVIMYEPIEKQIYTELLKTYPNLTYTIVDGSFVFKIDKILITLIIKGKISIEVETEYDWKDIQYQDIKKLSINLPANKDVTKIFDKIIEYINVIKNFLNEYKKIEDCPNDQDVQKELGTYFNNDLLECKFYSNKYDRILHFSISTINGAPADGVGFKITSNGLIDGWKDMDNLLLHMYWNDNSTSALKGKLEVVDYIESKVKNFDLNKFPLTLERHKRCLKIQELVNKYDIKSNKL